MSALLWLIPAALGLGLMGLLAFLWSVRSGQYDDLDGAAQRILIDEDAPLPDQEAAAEARDGEGTGEKS
ncbi:cbb3-type cytochrome oxidase assembly protein CcoS [Hyphobacterium marinum]|uniref:Cbb3-type cytochrome oxidase assembly protein CcoS n=1 Tax=Hyphobacterium marinum TaxID=3116574 RepID=A0ABU7LU26_9PROT|nr:cbb3-type cytochrome oxidase assembly protein CcoS [Hyphobacterium sp. Y6023]MEE2565071.1 cbb3-type cytochrome oxidase assembly protein CcoS [Hyphobacterium sp. Y6023]